MGLIRYPYNKHDYSFIPQYETSVLFPSVRGLFLPFDLRGSEVPLNRDFQYLSLFVKDKIFNYLYVHKLSKLMAELRQMHALQKAMGLREIKDDSETYL